MSEASFTPAQINVFAHPEGWTLADFDHSGLLQIQKLDESDAFSSDKSAYLRVLDLAAEGSALHTWAIRQHQSNEAAIKARGEEPKLYIEPTDLAAWKKVDDYLRTLTLSYSDFDGGIDWGSVNFDGDKLQVNAIVSLTVPMSAYRATTPT